MMKLMCLLSLLIACHSSRGAATPATAEPLEDTSAEASEDESEDEDWSEDMSEDEDWSEDMSEDEQQSVETAREIASTTFALIADLPNDLAAFRGEEIGTDDAGTVAFQSKGTEGMHARRESLLRKASGAYYYGATWSLKSIAPGILYEAFQNQLRHQLSNDGTYDVEVRTSPPGRPLGMEIVVLRGKRGIASFEMKNADDAAWIVIGSESSTR